jgi:hypothetical protein
LPLGRDRNVEHPIGPALVLNPQFSHRAVTRAGYSTAVRKPETWPLERQKNHDCIDRNLLGFCERIPPGFELVCDLDLPFQDSL